MGHTHTPDIIVDPDPHFTINTTTRAITKAEDNKKISLIQYDHNSERFSFDIDRMVEGHDVMDCNRIQIHFINIDGSNRSKRNIGLYSIDDLKVHPTNDKLATFTWLISEQATRYNGALSFLVSFSCTNEDETLYRWNSAIYSLITIAPGIDNNNAVAESYVDELLKWENYIVDNFDALEKELIETTIPAIVDERYIERDFATSEEVASVFSLSTDDVEIPDFTNLENGAGNYSLRQVFKDGETDYSAQATGKNAAAFGGKRYDKLYDDTRSATSAEGVQSFAAGGSNHAYGDWSIAMGADNKAYQRNAISLGKENKSGLTFEEYQALYPSATEADYNKSYAWATGIGVTNEVTGQVATGIGASNKVTDQGGVGVGHSNEVHGAFSVGIGRYNIISEQLSISIGDQNVLNKHGYVIGEHNTIPDTVQGITNYILGSGNNLDGGGYIIGYSNTGSGSGIILGSDNELNGQEDIVIGKSNTTAGTKYSTIIGNYCTVESGEGSTILGRHHICKGGGYNLIGGGYAESNRVEYAYDSVIYGRGLRVGNYNLPKAVFGQYNVNTPTAMLIVGNGTSDRDRKNIFEVLYDGRAKVQSAPTEDNDVTTKKYVDDILSSAISAAITTTLSTEV